MRVVLFTFRRSLSPVKEGAILEVHRESGGFTPPAQLNVFDFLFNRGGMPLTIPLGMALRNVYPACLRAPRLPHLPRLPRSSRRWYWGGIFPIPLALYAPCAMRHARYSTGAPCSMRSAPCPLPSAICRLPSSPIAFKSRLAGRSSSLPRLPRRFGKSYWGEILISDSLPS